MTTKLLLETFLPYRLSRAATQISHQFRDIYDVELKLTIPEWRVFATLGQFGSMTATEIAEHSSLHKTKVSRAVRALELRRWLVRSPGADRRVENLSLTTRGQAAYSKIVPRAIAFEDKLLSKLNASKKALLTALDRLENEEPTPRDRRRRRLTM